MSKIFHEIRKGYIININKIDVLYITCEEKLDDNSFKTVTSFVLNIFLESGGICKVRFDSVELVEKKFSEIEKKLAELSRF